MGNAESAPGKSKSKAARKQPEEPPANRGQVQNYSNRYGSPFNRTQFLSHSVSGDDSPVKGSSGDSNMFSCLTFEKDEEGAGGGGSVSTLYDVQANTGRQIVWEYQRFHPSLGWGAANFQDPGDLPLCAATNVRFATQSLEEFGDSMQSVAPPLPPGWQVDLSWAIVVQRRTRRRGGRGGG
jgi:hypothetical protein